MVVSICHGFNEAMHICQNKFELYFYEAELLGVNAENVHGLLQDRQETTVSSRSSALGAAWKIEIVGELTETEEIVFTVADLDHEIEAIETDLKENAGSRVFTRRVKKPEQ